MCSSLNILWHCPSLRLECKLTFSSPVATAEFFTFAGYQFSSVAQSCPALCDPMICSAPGLPVHHQLPELTQTHVHRVSDASQPFWTPKYWSFSLSINPSNEHQGLISFRMDWLDLIAVQGTLKSLLQHHSSKASILQHSAFFTVQPSHPYMTAGYDWH